MKRLVFGLLCSLVVICAACTTAPEEAIPASPEIEMVQVMIYFQDEAKFAVGTEPYEVGVIREFHPDAFIPRLALQAYFDGPTPEEYNQGLRAVLSNCTGFSDLLIEDSVAHVTLTGPCNSGGSTYTLAGPIFLTLKQFEEIEYVKLYNAEGNTEEPEGRSDSIPFELEP
ncbi:MAG: GerMN domain-containing protein [Anaerolineales bacterium]|nr:GerMN domain-containing protein [Anaerolineales bacterium]